jgi:hypothetical protein
VVWMMNMHSALDLRGNVMTCQNVSSLEVSKNGESHHGGNLDDYDNVELNLPHIGRTKRMFWMSSIAHL